MLLGLEMSFYISCICSLYIKVILIHCLDFKDFTLIGIHCCGISDLERVKLPSFFMFLLFLHLGILKFYSVI